MNAIGPYNIQMHGQTLLEQSPTLNYPHLPLISAQFLKKRHFSMKKLKLGGYVVHWIHFEEPKSLLRYFINYHNQASISLITSLIILITLK